VTSWPGRAPLAFEGFEKEGFVRLDDPGLVFGPMPGCIVQEAMAPLKAYGEAMLELRARKKLASLLGNEDEK